MPFFQHEETGSCVQTFFGNKPPSRRFYEITEKQYLEHLNSNNGVKMKEQQTNEKEVIEVDNIDKDNYKEYIGKAVKVKGDVDLFNLNLTKLPINFTEVGGSFDCGGNNLTSLEGAPKKVGGDFYCHENKLTSLEGAPK